MPDITDIFRNPSEAIPAGSSASEDAGPVDGISGAFRNPTGAYAKSFVQESVGKNRPWDAVEGRLKELGLDGAPLAGGFKMEQARLKAARPQGGGLVEKGLGLLGIETNDGPETTLQKFGRSYMPFGDILSGSIGASQYTKARDKVRDGKGSQEDIDTVARYEFLQSQDAKLHETSMGRFGENLGGLAKIVGEAVPAGAALGKLGQVTKIGQAERVTRGGRAAMGLGKATATTALTPAFYVPMAQAKNIEEGRQANDWKGYPVAVGYGVANMLVLGRLQGKVSSGNVVAQALKKGSLGAGELAGVDAAAGLADDFLLNKAWKVGTKYGTVGQLARGSGVDLGGKADKKELRPGLEHAAFQVLSFSALAAMHGRNPKSMVDTFAAEVNKLADAGLSPDAAGMAVDRRITPVQELLRDPTMTRESAIEMAGEAYKNDPMVRELIDQFPSGETTAEGKPRVGRLNYRMADPARREGDWPTGQPAAPSPLGREPIYRRKPGLPPEEGGNVSKPTAPPEGGFPTSQGAVEAIGESGIRGLAKQIGLNGSGKIDGVYNRIAKSPTGAALLRSRVNKAKPRETAPEAPPVDPPASPPQMPSEAPVVAPATQEAGRVGFSEGEGTFYHTANYKDPSKSVDAAMSMLDARGHPPKAMDVWLDSVRAEGNAAGKSVTFAFDRGKYDGRIDTNRAPGVGNANFGKQPLPFDPALKRVIYKGKKSDPEFDRLNELVEEINGKRAERGLPPVELEFTDRRETIGESQPAEAKKSAWQETVESMESLGMSPAEARSIADKDHGPQGPAPAAGNVSKPIIPGGAGGGNLGAPTPSAKPIPNDVRAALRDRKSAQTLREKYGDETVTPQDRTFKRNFDNATYAKLPKTLKGRAEPLMERIEAERGTDRQLLENMLRHAFVSIGRDGRNGTKNLLELWRTQVDRFEPTPEQLAAEEAKLKNSKERIRVIEQEIEAAAQASFERDRAKGRAAIERTLQRANQDADAVGAREAGSSVSEKAQEPGPEATPAGAGKSGLKEKPATKPKPGAKGYVADLIVRHLDTYAGAKTAEQREYLGSALWNIKGFPKSAAAAKKMGVEDHPGFKLFLKDMADLDAGKPLTRAAEPPAAGWDRAAELKFQKDMTEVIAGLEKVPQSAEVTSAITNARRELAESVAATAPDPKPAERAGNVSKTPEPAGGNYFGEPAGKRVSFTSKYYEPAQGVKDGQKAAVLTQPVVSSDGVVVTKGTVQPVDRLAAINAAKAIKAPVKRAGKVGLTDWLRKEAEMEADGIMSVGRYIKNEYGGIDPADFAKSFGQGELDIARENYGKGMFSSSSGGPGTGKVEDVLMQMQESGLLGEKVDPYELLEMIGKHRPIEDTTGRGYERAIEERAVVDARAGFEQAIRAEKPNITEAALRKEIDKRMKDALANPYTPAEEDIPFHRPPAGYEYKPAADGVKLTAKGREVGYTNIAEGGRMEAGAARRAFPVAVKAGETVGRLHGIEVDKAHQNKGLGKGLLLRTLAEMKSDWLYNSQLSKSATRAVESLARDGLAELHWQKKPGGVFVVRATAKGRAALAESADTPKHTPRGAAGNVSGEPGKPMGAFELGASIESILGVTNYVEGVTPYGNPAAVAVLKSGESAPQAVVTQKMWAHDPAVRLEEAGHVLAARHKLELSPDKLPAGVADGFLQFWGKKGEAVSRLSTLEGFSAWMLERAAGNVDVSTPDRAAAAEYAEAFVKKNNLGAKLDQVGELFQRWLATPAVERAAKLLSGNGVQVNAELPLSAQAKEVGETMAAQLRDALESNLGPLYRVEAALERRLGRKLEPHEKASTVYSQLMYKEKSIAGEMLRDGVKTLMNGKWVTIGQSESQILAGAKPEYLTPLFEGGPSKFDLWAITRHIEGEFTRGQQPVPDAQRADYAAAAAELAKDAEFVAWAEPAAERLTRAFLDSRLALESPDIHLLEAGTSDRLHKARPDYVPLERVITDKGWQVRAGTATRGERNPTILQKRSGSSEQIVSPLVAYRKRLFATASLLTEQIKLNSLMKLSQFEGMGDYVIANEAKLTDAGTEAMTRISDKLAELGIEGVDAAAMLKDLGINNGEQYFTTKPWPTDPTKATKWWIGPDGKPTNIRIKDRALYELVTDQQTQASQVARVVNGIANLSIGGVRPIRAMTDLVKLGATTANLAFHVRNLPRDAFTFFTNTVNRASIGELPNALKRAFAFEWGVLKANMKGENFKSADKLFQLFHDMRGTQLRQFGFDPKDPASVYDKAAGNVSKSRGLKTASSMWAVAKDMLNVTGAGELGPRFLEFKNRMKELTGKSEAEIVAELDKAEAAAATGRNYESPFDFHKVLDAMNAAAEVTTPFGRQGVLTRELNKIQPYFGPAIAGFSKAVRNLKDNPNGAGIGLAAMASLRVMHWLAFHQEDWYAELGPNDRYRNFVVPTPMGLRRIPSPRGFEVPVGGVLLPMLDAAFAKNPDVHGLLEASWEDMAPPAPVTPIGRAAFDVTRNENWRGTPIVPRRDEDLPTTDKALKYQAPYVAEQMTGGRGPLSFRGAGVVPFTEVQNARRSIDGVYSELETLTGERLRAKNRGEKFADERRFKKLEKVTDEIEDIGRMIRGERLVNGRVVKGVEPTDERKRELRQKQLTIARGVSETQRGE